MPTAETFSWPDSLSLQHRDWLSFRGTLLPVVLYSGVAGLISWTVFPAGLVANLVWAESYGLATLFAWRLLSRGRSSLSPRPGVVAAALLGGLAGGTLLGSLLVDGGLPKLLHAGNDEGVRHLLMAIAFAIPGIALIYLRSRTSTASVRMIEKERDLEETGQCVSEMNLLLFEAQSEPSVLIDALKEADELLARGEIKTACAALGELARQMRKKLADLSSPDMKAIEAVAALPSVEVDTTGDEEPGWPSRLAGAARMLAVFEFILLAVAVDEMLVLATPPALILIWVHCVGYAILACAGFIAHVSRQRLFDTLPLSGAWLVGTLLGQFFAGWATHADPWFMFADREALGMMPFSLFLSGCAALMLWQRQRLIDARIAFAKMAGANAKMARQFSDSRRRLLQAQIEPHFLFNVLSNVIVQARSHTGTARRMIELLIEQLATAIGRRQGTRSTLGDEIALVRRYLELQALRMGSRLTWLVDCPADLLPGRFPPLLLQPLVENAVRHGIEPASGPRRLDVRIGALSGTLTIEVSDDGVGMTTGHSSGVGVANIRDRLKEIFAGKASLQLMPNRPSGLIARLRMPLAS
jgi:hypothetical protein